MVIELSGVQFGLKSYACFQNRTRAIWNHKYDFRPKLHDTKFNYHFITPILKSHGFFVCALLFKNVLFPLFYVIREIHRFLHRGKAEIAKSPPPMTFFPLYFYAIWLACAIKPWNVIDSVISFSFWLAKKTDAI